MNEILKMLNTLSADDLDSIIVRATIMLEKKRKDEAEMALLEKERLRQEKIAQERRRRMNSATSRVIILSCMIRLCRAAILRRRHRWYPVRTAAI